MTHVQQVRVGDVLRLERREVTIDPITAYSLVGVYSFGKGIFHRPPTIGAELGDYRFFRIEPGDLVLSNIQAWEGAIARATTSDRGTIGTHRFLTYVPRAGEIDTSWARWFFLSEPGMRLIRRAAPGTAVRNRTLAIKRFEELIIPLPPIDEQMRVAASLGRVFERIDTLSVRMNEFRRLADATRESASNPSTDPDRVPEYRRLSSLCSINPRRVRVDPDDAVTFVPMAAVDAETGTVLPTAEVRRASDLGSGYRQFRKGDILFARITPCMQNGKCAIFDGPTDIGYGSSEFYVIRPHDPDLTPWIHRFLRSADVRFRARATMTGTAGQQRVPATYLEGLPVPIDAPSALRARVEALDATAKRLLQIKQATQHAEELASALRSAVVDREFAHLNE